MEPIPSAPEYDNTRSLHEGVAVLLAADDLSLDFLQIWDNADRTARGETLLEWAQRIHGHKAHLLVELHQLLTTWNSAVSYPAQKRAEAAALAQEKPADPTAGDNQNQWRP